MEKKHYFEITNKFEDFKERAIKRIARLETGLETLLKESKNFQHRLNALNAEINNKCKNVFFSN
jgi:chaperonin cofactor prefoldin